MGSLLFQRISPFLARTWRVSEATRTDFWIQLIVNEAYDENFPQVVTQHRERFRYLLFGDHVGVIGVTKQVATSPGLDIWLIRGEEYRAPRWLCRYLGVLPER